MFRRKKREWENSKLEVIENGYKTTLNSFLKRLMRLRLILRQN